MIPALAAALLLAGCASQTMQGVQRDLQGLFRGGSAEQELGTGIRHYEDGSYNEASRSIRKSLEMGLAKPSDQVKAYKYLAFIDCVSKRERQCRDNFRKILSIDPGFELDAAEAGHPTWGPVFRSVKSGR
jgi:Tfp pilus assembly protein PilF